MKFSASSVFRTAALLLVAVFPWTGCFETPYDPSGGKKSNFNPTVNVSSGDWMSVPSEGGSVEFEELSFNFPAGAFSGDSKVAVKTVNNSPFAETALSKVYQVAFPSEGTAKPFNLSIAYDGAPEDVVMLVQTPTFGHHTNQMEETVFPLDCTVSNGQASARIPVAGDADGHNPYFLVGLVTNEAVFAETKAADPNDLAYGKGGNETDGLYFLSVDLTAISRRYANTPSESKEILDKMKDLARVFKTDYIPSAFKHLKSLGFEIPKERITFKLEEFKDDAWGYSYSSPFFKEWGYIRLNFNMFKDMSAKNPYPQDMVDQLRQTCVHELFHTIHDYVYDVNRTPWTRAKEGEAGDHWAMLSEAIGCWAEKTTGDKRIGENCISFGPLFLRSFWPQERDHDIYQSHGYGMGLFIEWLARNTSDQKIVKLVEYQRSGTTSLQAAFDKFLAEAKLSFFTPEDYWKFASSIITGKFDDRITTTVLTGANIGIIKGIAQVPFTATGDIYAYGIAMDTFKFGKEVMATPLSDIASFDLTQDREDLISRVLLETANGLVELGAATKEKPFSCRLSALKNPESKDSSLRFFVVTTRSAKEDKGGQMVSRMHLDQLLWISSIAVEKGYDNYYWTRTQGETQVITVTKDTGGNFIVSADDGSDRIYFVIGQTNGKLGDLSGLGVSSYKDGKNPFNESRIALENFHVDVGYWNNQSCQVRVNF